MHSSFKHIQDELSYLGENMFVLWAPQSVGDDASCIISHAYQPCLLHSGGHALTVLLLGSCMRQMPSRIIYAATKA